MPDSLIDALGQEVEVFQKSLLKIQDAFRASTNTSGSKKHIAAKLDDLENIILAAASAMPSHIAEKARVAFNELRESVEKDDPSDETEVIQLCLRLQSQAEMINKRVRGILSAYNSTDNTANGIILAQEEERRRISREIHDGPAQTLASLTMKIDYCLEQPEVTDTLVRELNELKDSVIRSLKDIRRFIFDLRPMALDDLGLVPTLEQFISGFKKRTGVPVYVNIEGERATMNSDIELAVFRVIQEASNNAIKHADPSSVHIFVKYDNHKNKLSVVLKDDGKGFDVAEVKKNYGSLKKLGLKSMEERVRLAGGEFSIVSGVGDGTVVSFWVPL
ncbi:MAG: two-component system, NarL family, sensor histidine kinase DegS [Clostridiales bacterium]|jgi:signal transduction histidine kinase|nr:two-component system, NarL family, sensor histidine kinase DegS [Clostridiales bacterium]MDN5281991.1 two-component system, NarL family, sensor histidine kinase DegS [Candidatus Ozemobacter sp.]